MSWGVSRASWREVRKLTLLATPVALTQLSSMLLWTIDLLMVGRIDVLSLNAVSLGRIWVMGTSICAMGLIFGLDAIASQAHGARDRERLGDVLLHAGTLALAVSVPLGALWLATERLLLAFGQDPATAALAHRFVVVQIPGLPFFLLFVALKQYLQARGIVRPAMWVSFAACGFNAGLNWLLIFGHWGLPRMGAVGAGVATAITEAMMLLGLLAAIRLYRLQRGSTTVVTLRRLRVQGLAEILRLGFPVAVMLALEYWAFAISSLWAGWLGPVDLAAHSIALNLASITYMVPLGIGLGASARVGNLIGAGDPRGAQRAAWVAFALGGAVMACFALLFVLGRSLIPYAFTRDAAVVTLAATLLPIVAAFELFDGLQVVGSGVLRGMGRTRPAALFNLVGYYALGLPLAAWLGRPERLGLVGIWWGLALGLAVVAALSVAWVAVRGPARATALV
ncbi:MAG: MATE family efflux transporter [Thermoanaerobaculia bacterium]|nr:MATE family efflux transporter [Thermoanaerobaculia bacterium]